MSDIVKVRCLVCKKKTNAERKSKYLHSIGKWSGGLMWIVHALMLLMTGGIWIGWMLGRWYFDGKTNYCTKCNREVSNERII